MSQVLHGGKSVVEMGELKRDTDPFIVSIPYTSHLIPKDPYRAPVLSKLADQDILGRTFACAGRTEKTKNLALADFNIEPPQCQILRGGISVGQVLD